MTYTTVQGDMWDSIAYKLYGDVNAVDALISANPEYRKVYIFSAGIVLNVPDIEEKTSSDTLPDWKNAEG